MKEKREKKPTYREQIERAVLEMDMPAYALLDVPRIELTGDGRLLIERHHGILEYGDTCIRVAARGMAIGISGTGLQLQAMTRSEISVTGEISAVELHRQGVE